MKLNSLLAISLVSLLWSTLILANPSVELNKTALDEIKSSLQIDATTRALINAVSNNDVKSLVLNRELVNKNNEVFNVTTDVEGITNQKSTGRCWMFAGLNIMRPTARQKFNLKSFEFSQSYLFFWDKLEKSNMLLEAIIETRDRPVDDRELQVLLEDPVPDGGWWNYVVNLIEKYGVVPKEIMPETENSSKSKMMNKALETMVRQYAVELRAMHQAGKKIADLRTRKMEMLKNIYRLLVLHLGLPPDEFTWRYEDKDKNIVEKKYTPVQFYQEAVGFDLNQYITILDYPVYPYFQHFQIDYCRNMPDKADMDFINLDIQRIKEYVLKSLLDKEPVWFAADAGWQMERDNGIMEDGIYDYQSLYGFQEKMTKAERVQYHVSIPNHAMVFVAVDTSNGLATKWKVENSWGTDLGDKGYWTMYNNWFDKYVFTVIINKKYLPEKVLAILQTKPKTLPAWDPLRNSMP
ncbi:MAG: C1 family peptidase [Calditrichota bacterium]|jgi:bleomycin hydrolase